MLVIDPMPVGLAILQAFMTSLIPTIVTIVIANLLSPWTQRYPDWVHVFLFFGCGFYILWRRAGKRKASSPGRGRRNRRGRRATFLKGRLR